MNPHASLPQREQWKTAISSAVRGTPNRECGIAAAVGTQSFPTAVWSHGF